MRVLFLVPLVALAVPTAAAQTAAPDPSASRASAYAFASTGLRVALPPAWDGETTVDEARLPSYALYTFTSAAPGRDGAVLRVERVVGLDALARERWRTGAVHYGYHGTRPVGPAAVPVAGLGVEVAGGGRGGAVAFVQRGPTYWALHVSAPAEVWAARRADLLAALAAIDLP
jgi:hypothetical protein